MVFSSTLFLFLFLPLTLLGYFMAGPRGKNAVLLFASLFFYAWGETVYLLVMLFSILSNYIFGLLIERDQQRGGRGRGALVFAVACNLGLLAFFKYANFAVANLNAALAMVQMPPLVMQPVHLPIGISFFTFQALSYIIDLYRQQTTVQKSLLNFALYKSLFPQLIAGPIVRYKDVALEIDQRSVRLDDLGYGVQRFIIGLGKKVLIANVLGKAADYIFSLPPDRLPASLAWLGAIAYTLQIYYDFSGYSDMAIGLGRVFGFHFLENFNYPYISRSIREFWRRWHISLSSWFRDYLYIPLGGNKHGGARTSFNLLLVFFLCGLWHGANWTFIVWGLYHGCFLVFERTAFARRLIDRLPRALQHVYVMLVVIIGWVFFRAETLNDALGYLQAMLQFSTPALFNSYLFLTINNEFYGALVLGILGMGPIQAFFEHRAAITTNPPWWQSRPCRIAGLCSLVFVLVYSVASLMGGAHNPFLYFRF